MVNAEVALGPGLYEELDVGMDDGAGSDVRKRARFSADTWLETVTSPFAAKSTPISPSCTGQRTMQRPAPTPSPRHHHRQAHRLPTTNLQSPLWAQAG
jgi:hypothetical protein